MKTAALLKQYIQALLLACFMVGCIDNEPEVKELPTTPVAFTYQVVDGSYQLDYYIGATIEFTSISSLEGTCVWDFGDNSEPATGEVVTHKYKTAGTYSITLTVAGEKNKTEPIMIKDIVPIMSIDPIESEEGICEVITTAISISIELPNPEGLDEEYLWLFPAGTTDEHGNTITTSTLKNPGDLKFGNVGSQKIRLQTKLGGRSLEEGSFNVQVAYFEKVPTLYYAVAGGNIMALKLAENPPADMLINPFDMAISSGKHPLNILFDNTTLYVLDCGGQFTYVNDEDGNLGDGRIFAMLKDGSRVETMLSNSGGAAFDDPFYGYIEGSYLYFSNRNTGISRIALTDRNRSYSLADFPYYVQNALLGYYGNGFYYGSMNACFTKIDETWFWCKTHNGTGIFRFTDRDILGGTIAGGMPAPEAGVVLSGMSPKSILWDEKNQVVYFTVYDTGYEGLYRCTLEQLDAIGGSKSALAPYKLTTAAGKTVTPITEAGKGEGSAGEFIGICQLALDEETGCVYFGLRSAFPDEVKSGLMRYNPATGFIEHVIEGIDVYGVAVNKEKSKLF